MTNKSEVSIKQIGNFLYFLFCMLLVVASFVCIWVVAGFAPFVIIGTERKTIDAFLRSPIKVLTGAVKLNEELLQKTGTFGDTFGFANALFSGLACVGVAIAIFYQRKELLHTKHELNESQKTQRKNERERLLTANLGAVTSLAQSYAAAVTMNPNRDLMAERFFLKYKQLQEMILYEIQNFDRLYSTNRDSLTFETKREYLAQFMKTILGDWNTTRRRFFDAASGSHQRHLHFQEIIYIITSAVSAADTFLQQDGVRDSSFATKLDGVILDLRNMQTSLPNSSVELEVNAFFDKGTCTFKSLTS